MPKSFQRFTLNVELQNVDPPIWRRIEVEGTESLRKLHHILQAAFGWEDTHLHDFLIDGMTYAMFEVDDVADFADPGTTADDRKIRLQSVVSLGSRFVYRYDFGDGWNHTVVVEKMETVESQPWGEAQVIDGARACPPEDVGGPSGYEVFLNTLSNDRTVKRQNVTETGSAPASTRNCSTCVQPMQRCCVWLRTVGAIGDSDCDHKPKPSNYDITTLLLHMNHR